MVKIYTQVIRIFKYLFLKNMFQFSWANVKFDVTFARNACYLDLAFLLFQPLIYSYMEVVSPPLKKSI